MLSCTLIKCWMRDFVAQNVGNTHTYNFILNNKMWFELCVALGCEVLSEFAVRKSAFSAQNTRFGSGYFHPLVPTPASSCVPGQGCLFTAPQGSAFPITPSADPFHCSLCVIRGHAAQTRNKGNRYKIRHRENATK